MKASVPGIVIDYNYTQKKTAGISGIVNDYKISVYYFTTFLTICQGGSEISVDLDR